MQQESLQRLVVCRLAWVDAFILTPLAKGNTTSEHNVNKIESVESINIDVDTTFCRRRLQEMQKDIRHLIQDIN